MMQKPGTPSSMPSKTVIFNWIKQIVPQSSNKMKVQDLGDGVIYCRIINHYFPGSINLNRLNTHPKNQYDYSLNLKMFQNSLTVHKITVPFDVGKIAKQKFLQNWGLINALYRQLSSNNEESVGGQDSKSVSYTAPKFTPKRSFQAAFSNQQLHKLPQAQNFVKPVYNNPNNQATVHYQNNSIYTSQSLGGSQHIQPSANTLIGQPFTQNAPNPMYHSSHNQNSYGGFNFGMNSNSIPLNFMANNSQNLSFANRPQNLMNPNTMISQISKNTTYDHQIANKCWSVGKIPTRQSIGMYGNVSQENSGKYSVNSHMFQNNYTAVIDRVKQILLKNSHDIQKIRQIKILLNIPLNEDIVKIEEEENIMVNCTNIGKNHQDDLTKGKNIETKICTKQTIESKQNIELPEGKSIKEMSVCSEKANESSKSLSNLSSNNQHITKNQKTIFSAKAPQGSGKKIKNNFFGEGAMFRK